MQVPAPFEYQRVGTVDEAVALPDRLGDTARLVAGGHSLIPMMKLGLADFEYLIDINELHDEPGTAPDHHGYARAGVVGVTCVSNYPTGRSAAMKPAGSRTPGNAYRWRPCPGALRPSSFSRQAPVPAPRG
ncbi:FAD binding domain-containing protein [Streptomyces sp. NPDC014983]|uniref:FAD binding domain-containing protein n=1 Tax=Streptomyces sp. NPDC014983 TaxID=3364933 RepID=UPI0037020E02